MTKYCNLWIVVLTILCLVFFLASIITSVVSINQDYNTAPTQGWILVGGVTSTSATFRVRSQGEVSGVTLVVSESESLSKPILEQILGKGVDDELVYSVNVTSLQPQTTYYYATLRSESPTTILRRGNFRTPATEGQPFNFKIAVAGCSWTGSKSDIYRYMAAQDPLFMLHLGDFHYEDISANDLELRINAVDLVLGSDSQRELYSKVPIAYTWDDHDWMGNDSGEREKEPGARETALKSYQIAFPHHALALEGDAVPLYQAFTIGTVRFIISDLRSEANETNMYSTEQRDWLFNELSQADQYDFVIWASSKPWIGEVDLGDDNWTGQPNDRKELSEFISTTLGKAQNLLAVSSDAHMLAFDDGSNTYYGNDDGALSFPILQSGPMDRLGSVKGGPFSDGCYTVIRERNHQYSTISFEMNGTEPCLEITTYDNQDVVMQKTLCGKIFKEAAPGTGTCSAPTFRPASTAMLAVSVVLWAVVMAAACYVLGIWQGLLVSSIAAFFLVATLMSALVPVSKGISQWNVNVVLIIAVVQMSTVTMYCGYWFYTVWKKQSEDDAIDEDGISVDVEEECVVDNDKEKD